MRDAITIRRAETPSDYQALQTAQRRAWGITEDCYIVPIATMVGAQLHGGLVLGAFLPSGEAVALSFAFLGLIGERIGLYSQLLGVVPEHQKRGLGEQVKAVQRELAREAGIDLIAWAFDPLQAGNAHFNLDRLGATTARYIDDMYGPRTDELNAGVPTDRLIVEWELERPPCSRVEVDEARRLPRMIATDRRDDGRIEVGMVVIDSTPARTLLEIPSDIKSLRRDDPDLAEAWRLAVRQAFRGAFAAGYRAVGFVRDGGGGARRGYYISAAG